MYYFYGGVFDGCVWICEYRDMCAHGYMNPVAHMWRSEGSFQESVLPLYRIGSKDQTQVARLANKGFTCLAVSLTPHLLLFY